MSFYGRNIAISERFKKRISEVTSPSIPDKRASSCANSGTYSSSIWAWSRVPGCNREVIPTRANARRLDQDQGQAEHMDCQLRLEDQPLGMR